MGRCLLILKAHKIDEIELTDEEMLEKHRIYCEWRAAVTNAFNPDKINQAQLGNEEYTHKGHIHWHLVPRYRRQIRFADTDFLYDDAESQKGVADLFRHILIHPVAVRQKIKEELLKYL